MTKLIERYPIQTRVATAVTVVVAIIGITITLVRREDSALADICTLQRDFKALVVDHKALVVQVAANATGHHLTAVELAKINTKLAGIQALLVELKDRGRKSGD